MGTLSETDTEDDNVCLGSIFRSDDFVAGEGIKVDGDEDDFFSASEAEERVHASREGARATRSLLTAVQGDMSCPPSTRSRRPTSGLTEVLSPEATLVRDLGGVMEEWFMMAFLIVWRAWNIMDGGSVDTFCLRMVWHL